MKHGLYMKAAGQEEKRKEEKSSSALSTDPISNRLETQLLTKNFRTGAPNSAARWLTPRGLVSHGLTLSTYSSKSRRNL